MPAFKKTQYTIRGVPQDVDASLRRRARQRGMSLNQFLLEELRAASFGGSDRNYRDLGGIAGAWREDPSFEAILAEQRQVDEDLWK
ncbi:MAG: antitoxin [Acidobacteria bacterium]|nr:antitoxin [Acidobacteriota bacterium]